ncbi:MAG: Gfo/Idh/MocA family oxidoreductase [Planctomycetota bacterium]|nr:Gfo/Idh/MocA family oxidoreductase [Planctomycetota bacterium]
MKSGTVRTEISRRGFLQRAVVSAGVLAAPAIIPASALGADGKTPPSERIVMGSIGVGGRGGGLFDSFRARSDVEMVAVCDVREERSAAAASRAGTQCKPYADFRELLERKDIDAVIIATPDHWHGLVTVAACKAGKDVYCEKPLTRTIAEGRVVCETVRRYARVLQTGSHERSNQSSRHACELVRNGRIGKLHTVLTNLPVTHPHVDVQPTMPVPPGFDYDMWLGPAPWVPYTERRCTGSFRYISDYAMGEFSDRGAHVHDLAHWGMGMDASGPLELEGRGERPAEGLFNTFREFRVEMHYPGGVTAIMESKEPRGVKFIGEKGWINIAVHGSFLSASDESILRSTLYPGEIRLHASPGSHQNDFIEVVKTRGKTVCHPEVGHRTNSACCLAEIAMLLGRKLKWDPVAERFVGDDEANRLLVRPMRAPWRM